MADLIQFPKKYDCDHLIGQHLDRSHYDILVTKDTDGYRPGIRSEDTLLFKFRRAAFGEGEQRLTYEALQPAAVPSNNRGPAAGPITGRQVGRDWVTEFQTEVLCCLSGQSPSLSLDEILRNHAIQLDAGGIPEPLNRVWLRSKILGEYEEYDGWFDDWLERVRRQPLDVQRKAAKYVLRHFISNTTYGSPARSGVAGFFGRHPRLPYGRTTDYTMKNRATFAKCYSYIRKLDAIFKSELPNRWQAQRCGRWDRSPLYNCRLRVQHRHGQLQFSNRRPP